VGLDFVPNAFAGGVVKKNAVLVRAKAISVSPGQTDTGSRP